MGREKRGGYIIEWWMGDHQPKHVHIYKDGDAVAKVSIPEMTVLNGRMNRKLKEIIEQLMKEGRI